jgi:soluble lytic murein transglycosylase-like protein
MTAPEPRPNEHPERRQDRRREDASERRATASGDSAAGVDRRRRVMRRFRQPLIGLGLAGMAIPMVNATATQDDEEPEPARGAAADPDTAAALAAEDTEEQLAERIAETREAAERSRHVESAMEKYGISRDLAEDIYDIAREQNIEPRLAYGLVKTESTFDERAVSHVGARGLTQVMPRTAAWLVPGTKTADLYDRQTNLRLGFRYLDQMIDKYRGDVRLALLAYNRGPGTVDKVLKRGGNPDNGYADKVLRG